MYDMKMYLVSSSVKKCGVAFTANVIALPRQTHDRPGLPKRNYLMKIETSFNFVLKLNSLSLESY